MKSNHSFYFGRILCAYSTSKYLIKLSTCIDHSLRFHIINIRNWCTCSFLCGFICTDFLASFHEFDLPNHQSCELLPCSSLSLSYSFMHSATRFYISRFGHVSTSIFFDTANHIHYLSSPEIDYCCFYSYTNHLSNIHFSFEKQQHQR